MMEATDSFVKGMIKLMFELLFFVGFALLLCHMLGLVNLYDLL